MNQLLNIGLKVVVVSGIGSFIGFMYWALIVV